MCGRERFLNVIEYKAVDKVPNYEMGVWGQTAEQWEKEKLPPFTLHYDWFTGEEYFDMDYREFIPVNYGMLPLFEEEILEQTERYIIKKQSNGIVTKALIEGTVRNTRLSMDQYLSFPVNTLEDFHNLKKRYKVNLPARYPLYWKKQIKSWKTRDHVLVLGKNCAAGGFYWTAREWMGTENLSYAWYDQPKLMHEMMEFIADFIIEVSRPIVEEVDLDYFNVSEDLAMKNGPLLSPEIFKKFIFPHLKRLVDFFKFHGTKYFTLDTDGNFEVLIPLFMEAGVDLTWPLERAANMDPLYLRKKFGKSLKLMGGVDKRELAKDKKNIKKHLESLIPLIEEGGYIPTIDHTVQPGVSWENFCYYMDLKKSLLLERN